MGKKRRISEIKMLNKIQETYLFDIGQIAYELGVDSSTVRSWFEGGTAQQHNYINLKKLYGNYDKWFDSYIDTSTLSYENKEKLKEILKFYVNLKYNHSTG